MDEQEEKNQEESSIKQAARKGKDKLKDEGKKQAKKKILQLIAKNPKVIAIIAIVILVVIILVILFAGFLYVLNIITSKETSEAKSTAVSISYDGQTGTTENTRIIIKPTNNGNYEISNNYTDEELEELEREIRGESNIVSSEFSDFEIAVLGALLQNGLDLDSYDDDELHCLPYFLKAESSTQFLDLRKNSEKFDSQGNYEPELLDDLEEEEVPGIILVQRTNTNDNNPTTLEYIEKAEFDKMVNNNDIDVINYFTMTDGGKLLIAKWDHVKVDVEGKYPDNISEDEKETERDEDIISTEEIDYSQYVKKYTMPFDFLVQLLVITEEPDFCKEIADIVLGSKIVINIQEEETVTVTTEVKDYTVHNKDEKRINYYISPEIDIESNENYLINNATDDEGNECTNYNTEEFQVTTTTTYTSHSYVFEISEADTWLAHYQKTYQKQEAVEEPENKTTSEIKGNYSDNEPTVTTIEDSNRTIQDEDVKEFKDSKEKYYRDRITIPEVEVSTSSNNSTPTKTITITPQSMVKSVAGLNNGYTYTGTTDASGNIIYNLPGSIAVTTNATNEIPSIDYIYTLYNDDEYRTTADRNGLTECVVEKLETKTFQKTDIVNNITVNVTRYPADPNPTTRTHIYATKSGNPGRGYGDETTEYEKFLVAYNNNRNAIEQINSVDSWLYEMMEENQNTVNMVDTVKYLLYMYDGINRGVTELDLEDIFGETNMNTFGGSIYGNSIEEKVWFALREQGYSEEAVAAVMGNIYGESGFKADAIESNGEGYGLCQWSFGRKTQLINYAKSKGKDWTDEDIQIEFLIGEITKGGGANGYAKFQMSGTHYGYTYSSWKDATDVEEATKAFMAVFERPDMTVAHTDRRVEAAKKYLSEFHGRERSGGEYAESGRGEIIGTFTSQITGRTFTIFNQNRGGLSSTRGSAWGGYCNKCVAATIATGYNGGNVDDALNRTLNWGSILSNTSNTNAYFSNYGLQAKVSGGGSYSTSNLRSNLTNGKYIAIWFNGVSIGKSGQNYCNSVHWIGILGYKNENGKEQIFVADSAHGGTGWKDLDEFENCKGNIQYFTVISEK